MGEVAPSGVWGEALKRIEADFTHRHDLAESVLEELKAAEYRLMRR